MSLNPNSKERVRREIEFMLTDETVGWRNPITDDEIEQEFEADVRMKDQPDTKRYPQVVMEFSPDGVPQERIDLMGPESDHEIREPRPHDDEIAYDRWVGAPMYSVLNVSVSADSSLNPIPKHIVADDIAHKVYTHLIYDTQHLNNYGTTADGEVIDYEWPLVIEPRTGDGIMSNHGMVDEKPIAQRNFQLRVEYFYWRHEEVPQTSAVEVRLALDSSGDGEIDVRTEPQWIPEEAGEDIDYRDGTITGTATISASAVVDEG